jgi:hypothetical protein
MADRFRAMSFAAVIAQLQESATLIRLCESGGPQPDELVRIALKNADVQFKELRLSNVLRDQWRRLMKHSEDGRRLSDMALLITEMYKNLAVELSSACFLMIPADRRFIYEQMHDGKLTPIFGQDTDLAFPEARRDIAAAGRCYALGEWTACVVHLMRALEHALRWLAKRVGLKPEEYQGEQWKNIIDRIEKKIRELEQAPKSPQKSTNVQFLSEAATQFRWFKDAWRNEAAHAHVYYGESEGAPIFLHVSDFCRHIAAEAVKDTSSEQK